MTRSIVHSNQPWFFDTCYQCGAVLSCVVSGKAMAIAFCVLSIFETFPGGIGSLTAQESIRPKSPSPLIQAAIDARKQSSISVEKFKRPMNAENANPYREATEQQIRNQIDLMKQLNSTMDRTKNERDERITNIRSDIQLLMLELQKINDAKANAAPRINQASSQKTLDSTSVNQMVTPESQGKTTETPTGGGKKRNAQPSELNDVSASKPKSDSNASNPNNLTPFETMANDPVDKLGLANNLVAIGSYQTAIQIFLELSKDATLDETTKNWVYFQLGRCYLSTDSIPEAKEAFKKSAESIQSDIAQRTSKWWLDQLEAQLSIDESLNNMQETLTKLEATYGSNK